MAHTLLYTIGYNAPEHRILSKDNDWADPGALDDAIKKVAHALRPRTLDFHVAQNDATAKGVGSHDKTGRHCMVGDPNGSFIHQTADSSTAWNRASQLRQHFATAVPQIR